MGEHGQVHEASSERLTGDRLREMARRSNVVGKRNLKDLFDRGRILDEAAELAKGNFRAWVKSECRIEPSTAFGYRKAYRVLGDRREWLTEKRVSPSVVVILARARPSGRDAALAAIGSGRFLTASEARRIVSGRLGKAHRTPTGFANMRAAVRHRAGDLVTEIEAVVDGIIAGVASETELAAFADRASRLLPMAHLLFEATIGSHGEPEMPHPVTSALSRFAAATGHATRRAVALELAATLAGPSDGPIAQTGATDLTVNGNVLHPAASEIAPRPLMAIEICAGAGGQAIGLSEAGFRHSALVELNPHACETLRAAFGPDPVVEGNLADYDPSPGDVGPLDLIAGGVPCQGFSKLGQMQGAGDARDMFPEALRLVERLKPRAVMLENVEGIFAPNFETYRLEILGRLERAGYTCEWRTLDATHFGVPQKRIRSFLVGFRDPGAMDRFAWPQAIAGYDVRPRTVYDVLEGLLSAGGWDPTAEIRAAMNRAAPTVTGASDKKKGWDFGQRKAAAVWRGMGFVTSGLGDMPPAADHEGPVLATTAMLAAIQGFPAGHPFRGSRKLVAKQISNALPPAVACHLGRAIAFALEEEASAPTFPQDHLANLQAPSRSARRHTAARMGPNPRSGTRQQATPTLGRTRMAAT